MNRYNKIIMFVLAAIIFISFFLPWIEVESVVKGGVTKVLTGESQASFLAISGFQVPIIANGPESRLMISIIKLFNPGITNADKKSYLIWAIPGLAVVISAIFLFLEKNKWMNLAVAIIGISIFFVSVFKIMTTNLDKLVLKVNIAIGLWLIFFAYLGMGLLCLVNLISLFKIKKA